MSHRRNTRKNDLSTFRALGREVEGLAGALDEDLQAGLNKVLGVIWGKDPTALNEYKSSLPKPKEVLQMGYPGLKEAYGQTLSFFHWRVGGKFEEPKPRRTPRSICGNTWWREGY